MQWFRPALGKALGKEINWASDNLRWTLHTSGGYLPQPDTHAYVSSLTGELATGGGYTAGGLPAGGMTNTYTPAAAWAVTRANATAYNLGDVVKAAGNNNYLYRCTVAGTTAAAPPAYPTVLGAAVADGTATFECAGSGIIVLGCANPTWAAATFTARYLVLSDRAAGAPAAQPLIGYFDFGADASPANQPFTVTLHPSLGALAIVVP